MTTCANHCCHSELGDKHPVQFCGKYCRYPGLGDTVVSTVWTRIVTENSLISKLSISIGMYMLQEADTVKLMAQSHAQSVKTDVNVSQNF